MVKNHYFSSTVSIIKNLLKSILTHHFIFVKNSIEISFDIFLNIKHAKHT